MTHRYTPVHDLHFPVRIAETTTIVVTMQRCDAKRAPSRRSEFAVLHNGRTVRRGIFHKPDDLAAMDAAFVTAAAKHAGELLTEDQARDLIGQYTGSRPEPRCCLHAACSAAVPLGDYRCADGHSLGRVGSGSMSGVMRRPILLPTGGTR